MKIIADENIPFAVEAFGTLGEVEAIAGREATPETFRECDLFLCRSVTPVNEAMLGGSPVKFVGTATIGTDHVDLDFLRERGIGFASAPGSNANSVAEYVVAALLVLARRGGYALEGKRIGVVGVGNVGSRVVAKCAALGMRVLQNDPPLARQTREPRFRPLEEVLGCDFLTFHTPLTAEGEDATLHLADETLLRKLPLEAVVLNTSRGAVVANGALWEMLVNDWLGGAVLDVWESEPELDEALLELASIGTPHIAGYSFDGKVCATDMIYRAACGFLGVEPTWSPAEVMPPPEVEAIEFDCSGARDEEIIGEAVAAVYDIEADDHDLREITEADEPDVYFDRLRKTYPQRREFHNTTVHLANADARLTAKLAGLGFKTGDA